MPAASVVADTKRFSALLLERSAFTVQETRQLQSSALKPPLPSCTPTPAALVASTPRVLRTHFQASTFAPHHGLFPLPMQVAFTILWIMLTSQLGHYSKLFGPQVRQEGSDVFAPI